MGNKKQLHHKNVFENKLITSMRKTGFVASRYPKYFFAKLIDSNVCASTSKGVGPQTCQYDRPNNFQHVVIPGFKSEIVESHYKFIITSIQIPTIKHNDVYF